MSIRGTAAAVAVLLGMGCATGESDAALRVYNSTSEVLAVFPFPDGSLVDPVLHLPPGSFEENIIGPDRALTYNEIPEFQPEQGVTLFVYIVQRQGADLTIVLNVSGRDLVRFHRQVVINSLPSPRE